MQLALGGWASGRSGCFGFPRFQVPVATAVTSPCLHVRMVPVWGRGLGMKSRPCDVSHALRLHGR